MTISVPVIIGQTEEISMMIGDEGETIETRRTFRTFETRQMIGLTQCLNDLNMSLVTREQRLKISTVSSIR